MLENVKSDFHVHTSASYDTPDTCTIDAIVRVAHGLGIEEMGLTDHVHIKSVGNPGFDQQNTGYAAHNALREAIRGRSWNIAVYLSWEVDYFDGGGYSFDPDHDPQRLDYVLLGHHYVRHKSTETDSEKARYICRITEEMAGEPYAHIIAHPFYDSGGAVQHERIMSKIADSQLREIFYRMKENGKAAEITAYQFHADSRAVGHMKRMYSIARETGVKFVLDSDAHSIGEIGSGYRCLHVLRELGFQSSDFVDYAGLMALK